MAQLVSVEKHPVNVAIGQLNRTIELLLENGCDETLVTRLVESIADLALYLKTVDRDHFETVTIRPPITESIG